MKFILPICIFFLSVSLYAQKEVLFEEEALNDSFLSMEGSSITFEAILEKHRGKTILIDVWSSWCKDCIVGMPIVNALQIQHEDVVFLFLSMDKNIESWKKGIEKYHVKGEHYFVTSGWKGPFGSSIKLDWIPRYMVVGPEGHIQLYKAVKANDENIQKALKINHP